MIINKVGKFGCYFYDEEQNAELTLKDIETSLNDYVKVVKEYTDIQAKLTLAEEALESNLKGMQCSIDNYKYGISQALGEMWQSTTDALKQIMCIKG